MLMRALMIIFAASTLVSCERNEKPENSEIPFELSRNKIIVPVTVGNSREFRIILDTGMPFEGLLLYNSALIDSISIGNTIKVRVPGAGADSAAHAIMTDSGSFCIGDVECINQRIIILEDETMKGFPTDGVTGFSLFGNYIVEICYDRMKIILHESDSIAVDSSWACLPLTFGEYKIPWIDGTINIAGEKDIPVSMPIDGASSEALELLMRDEMKFQLPDKLEECYLGRGLSGDIYGYRGRIASLQLGTFVLKDVVTAFAPVEIRSKQKGADGIIGNDVLRRFNTIFDYKKARLYLKPNKSFGEAF